MPVKPSQGEHHTGIHLRSAEYTHNRRHGLAHSSAATLKKEPAMGSLKQGQRVLVDDGTCPKGQIKEVIGGNHSDVGGNSQIKRTRRCVQRK